MERQLAVSLTTTKCLIPPLQQSLVPRQRLMEQMNQVLQKKLTLVSAPAGYGKTMLLSSWANLCRIPMAWISLDDGENDLARFLAYLVASLEKIKAGICKDIPDLNQSPQLPLRKEFISDLINEIEKIKQPFVLILDDYHLISEQAIHDAVIYLLANLPPQMHLVISSRSDPPLKLARMRALSELNELRMADLCFTPQETNQLLNEVMTLELNQEQVIALTKRTEGWIAGLQMAAVSLRNATDKSNFIRSFSGSNRYILDYLVEEVLRGQPEQVQAFLIKTSILDRLTASLCDEVVGQDDSREILEFLERANLFIVSLDEERNWYRYHQLFRDLLSKKARQLYPGEVIDWHRRAHRWYERNGSFEESIEHALLAKDYEHATKLIDTFAQPILSRGEFYTFKGWIKRLPETIIGNQPDLILFYAWALVATDSPYKEVESWLKKVDVTSEGNDAKVGILRGFLEFVNGEVFRAENILHTALANLPDEDSLFHSIATWLLSLFSVYTGNFSDGTHKLEALAQTSLQKRHIVITAGALCAMAEIHQRLGQLKQAKDDFEQALSISRDSRGRLPVAARALMGMAELMREWNDLETAEGYCLEGIELAKSLREVTSISAYITLANVRRARGDEQGAFQAMDSARELALQTEATDLDDIIVSAYRARLAVMCGNLKAVEIWMRSRNLESTFDLNVLDQKEDYYRYHILKYELLVIGRLLIASDQPGEALTLLDTLHKKMEGQGRIHLMIETLLLSSIASHNLGNQTQAQEYFERCLFLAEPGGYVRLFLDEGPVVGMLLQGAIKTGTCVEYASKLLQEYKAGTNQKEAKKVISQSQTPQQPNLLEPLTERELELLLLISKGLSNQAIAQRLFISLPTVKWHTSNIYRKLGVSSRTQAIVQAKTLNLFPFG